MGMNDALGLPVVPEVKTMRQGCRGWCQNGRAVLRPMKSYCPPSSQASPLTIILGVSGLSRRGWIVGMSSAIRNSEGSDSPTMCDSSLGQAANLQHRDRPEQMQARRPRRTRPYWSCGRRSVAGCNSVIDQIGGERRDQSSEMPRC